MKTLRDYVTETEQWADRPREGDEFDIELAPDELVEGRVIESDGEHIVLELSESAVTALEYRGLLSERIGRYGAVGSSRGMGYTVAEGVMSEIDMDLRQIAQDQDPGQLIDALQGDMGAKTAEYLKNMMQEIEIDLERQGRGFTNDVYRNLDMLMDRIVAMYADDAEIQEQEPVEEDFMGRMLELAGMTKSIEETAPIQPDPNAARTDPLAAKAADLAPVGTEQDPTTATTVDEGAMKDVATELAEIADNEDYDRLYDLLTSTSPAGEMVQDMYSDVARDFRLHPDDDSDMILDRLMDRIADDFGGQLDEAEYQGRKVELNKPKRGGSKKFYVYVKDPKTKNIRKVSFGDPNMKIKKSNPARRKSFRARHRCDNPGPKTSARYWACRSW